MIYEILVDVPIGSEDVLLAQVESLGNGRVLRDPKDPDELFYTEPDEADEKDLGGWAVVWIRDMDPVTYSREIQRRVLGLRIVAAYEHS